MSSLSKGSREALALQVLVVGQTPPPYHGQAIAIEQFVRGSHSSIEIHHVRMDFSREPAQVGRFSVVKLWRLIWLVFRTLRMRCRLRDPVLYYPPAGPNIVPVIRDMAVLSVTRPFFRRMVFHFHATGSSTLYARFGWIGRFFFRRAYHNPDLAICLSPMTTEDARAFAARRISVVPNGVADMAAALPAGPKPEPVRLLYVGSIRETKGVLVLLDAVHLLRETGSPFRLVIMGAFLSPEFERHMRRQVSERGLDDLVTFVQEQTGEAKWREFGEASVFCFPTFYEAETLPLVVIEAMACSLPVVSTQWRGIPSMVQDGVTGFLTPPQDPVAFADRLAILVRDSGLRARMGTAGRKVYEARYTEKCFLQSMEEAIGQLAC